MLDFIFLIHTNLVLVLDFPKLSYDFNLGEFFFKQKLGKIWELFFS